MKKITTIIFAGALAIPSIGLAQVNVSTTPENRNAVVEEWTGIHCGYCPVGHATVQEQMAANPNKVVAINIHSGSFASPGAGEPDFQTTEGDVLDGAFPISGYPSSTLNRRTISFSDNGTPTTSQVYHPAYLGGAEFIPTVLGETSEVNMYAEASIDISTNELTVDVEYYYTSNAGNPTNYLNVAIVQNNIPGPQSDYGDFNPTGWIDQGAGIYNHMHVFRQFLTGQWGEAISTTTSGSTGIMSYTLTLPADYKGVAVEASNIEVVAYINNGAQSAGDVMTGISVHPTLTGFTATDEVIFSSASSDDIETCDISISQTISPKTTIQNWGSNAMTSATIAYDINGGAAATVNWTGSLAPGASEEVTLDPITFVPASGSNTINVTVSDPNGVADNTADNAGSGTFTVSGATETQLDITVNFFTDFYPGETSWEILSGAGTAVASGGPYTPGTDDQWGGGGADAEAIMTSTHTLPSAGDCYSVRLLDNYGDGQQYGTGQNTNGGFCIQIMDGATEVFNWDGGSGWAQADKGAAIKTDGFVGLDEIETEQISVFPNPASTVLNINVNLDAEVYSVAIMDLQGKVVVSKAGSGNVAFSVVDMASGNYLAAITTAKGVYTEKVIIK